MVQQIADGIYSFEIVLPDNPLKWLNCYVVKGNPSKGERNLLIDSGFNRPECHEALLEGIRDLGLEPEHTDVLFTHLHADHTGGASVLEPMGFQILMGEDDYSRVSRNYESRWKTGVDRLGIPQEILQKVMDNNPGIIYSPPPFHALTLKGCEVLEYGGRKLECILTPGHTPGHICLYDREHKTMFSGDHVLFDITPNIVSWHGHKDSLGDYLESLRRIREYPVETALPAHRTTGGKSFVQRIDELLVHHERRLNETRMAAESLPGSSAFDVAGHVTWKIRARNWEEFPPGQKWFAVGECLAHLEYLEFRNILRMEKDEMGVYRFYPIR